MTYLPKHFEQNDATARAALLRTHPFAAWVQPHAGELLVNHLPFMLDAQRGAHGTLVGHVARANPAWAALGEPGVAVFQGPHAYISPNWYPSKHAEGKAVPTWNYAVVHAHGKARAIEDRVQLLALVTRLTQIHEAGQALPWRVSDAPADYIDKLLGAIVGIEIEVTRWVAKWKLGQNRSAADRLGVAAGLSAQPSPQAQAMTAFLQAADVGTAP